MDKVVSEVGYDPNGKANYRLKDEISGLIKNGRERLSDEFLDLGTSMNGRLFQY